MPEREQGDIVGRTREKRLLDAMLASPEAELLALYGRRRVGKTFLVREYLSPRADVYFEVVGEKDATAATQLGHFRHELERVFYGGRPLPGLRSWREAFALLADVVERATAERPGARIVVFLDELPWLASPKSGLLQALDHTWNQRLARSSGLRMILCGSAASWMLDKLIHAKGGLHNRITRRIRLEPFTLGETQAYLESRDIRWSQAQVLELYLALGGVPYYLRQVRRGLSAAQNIGELCFERGGMLFDELPRLFSSLFVTGGGEEEGIHERIVRAIAGRRQGTLRKELLVEAGLTSGGGLARRLRELEEAGFVARLTPYGNLAKHATHRLVDEYCWFYLSWIERAPRGVLATGGRDYWQGRRQTPAYRAWAGYAFESVCLKHARQLREALGIASVPVQTATWRYVPPARDRSSRGAQVDLLFDREDGVVTLCEVKHATDVFALTKRDARELREKLEVFEARTGTRKQTSLVLVTTHGLRRNAWSEDLVDGVVTMEALFGGGQE